MFHSTSRTSSISSQSSSTKSGRAIWSKISRIFNHHQRKRSNSDVSHRTTALYSVSSLSDESVKTDDFDLNSSHRRQRKQLINHPENTGPQIMIPPFSPTYCKDNEFPYSNFYVKLPDGRWMIRYRDGNRDILRTDIMEGYMI